MARKFRWRYRKTHIRFYRMQKKSIRTHKTLYVVCSHTLHHRQQSKKKICSKFIYFFFLFYVRSTNPRCFGAILKEQITWHLNEEINRIDIKWIVYSYQLCLHKYIQFLFRQSNRKNNKIERSLKEKEMKK